MQESEINYIYLFNPHKSFPNQMQRHAKAWKFKRPLSQNEEPFGTENLSK